METPADFRFDADAAPPCAVLTGDWTAAQIGEAGLALADALQGHPVLHFDLTGVRRMDSAGAYAIVRASGDRLKDDTIDGRPDHVRLLDVVEAAIHVKPVIRKEPTGIQDVLVRIGRAVVEFGGDFMDTMGFLGRLQVVTVRVAVRAVMNPRRVRWATLVNQMERAGLDAIPIVAITTFFIGAVVAFIGVDMLRQFGAEVFSVELIGVAVLREFNIVITAVLLAGRSASAFAAEIGAMKMNQEIDAMQVMGVDPYEALVLPRFLALVLTVPLLTFVATLAGLFGGLMVTWSTLGLGPAFFLQRIVDNVGVTHFGVALVKAPFMAAVVAGIGCRQGLEVGGDVESLGRRVTAAVVHAIFSIIMLDALFALLFMELDI